MKEPRPLRYYAEERLDESIDYFLITQRIPEDTLRVKRPEVRYNLVGSHYDPLINTVTVGPTWFNSMFMYGEEAAHWLFHSVNPDETITGFNPHDKSDENWLLLSNVHELLGRYGANIYSNGASINLIDDYIHLSPSHRTGYSTADTLWKEHGDALFADLLFASIDEIFALLDQYGIVWDEDEMAMPKKERKK